MSHGLYLPASAAGEEPTQRILDVGQAIAGRGVIGGWAAAYIHGAHWLDGIDAWTFARFPVDCLGLKRRQRPGVCYRGSSVPDEEVVTRPDEEVVTRHGLKVTSPLRTAFDGARWSASLEEAVVFVDAMATQAGILVDELIQFAERHPRVTGSKQARAAAVIGRPGIRSPWESRLRFCYQYQAGLPSPLLNVPVFWGERLLGIPDLFDPVAALASEFDGTGHRERQQHREDNIREERFEAANVTVTRYDSLDLMRDRPRLVRRLRNAWDRGLGRDHNRDRWTLEQPAWWERRRTGQADREGECREEE